MFEVAAFISNWAGILAFALTSVNIISNWVSGPGKKLEAKFVKLDEETTCAIDELNTAIGNAGEKTLQALKEHDRRIQSLEDERKHLPTTKDLHAVDNKLTEIATMVGVLGQKVDRMDRHLLESGK